MCDHNSGHQLRITLGGSRVQSPGTLKGGMRIHERILITNTSKQVLSCGTLGLLLFDAWVDTRVTRGHRTPITE